jgi:hypothetical protein
MCVVFLNSPCYETTKRNTKVDVKRKSAFSCFSNPLATKPQKRDKKNQ